MRPRLYSDEEILTVTRQCVVERGPTISTSYIAEKAGVSQATLFKRFGSKSSLLQKALSAEFAYPWIPRLEAGPTSESLEVQLQCLASALIPFYAAHLVSILTWRRMNSEGGIPCPILSDTEEEIPPPKRALLALTAWFETAQTGGRLGEFHAPTMAISFLGGCQAPALRKYLTGESIDLHAYGDKFVAGFWRGISL
jgi:AcrR family transcriptional regulator